MATWFTALALVLWGTSRTRRHLIHEPSVKRSKESELHLRPEDLKPSGLPLSLPRRLDSRSKLQPVSILKPVKGLEENLKDNLESFFKLDYPQYELIFSVAEAGDAAVQVITTLISRFPRIRAKLLIGDIHVGPNPKVNNLVRSYGEARHDWILISDSNVRVERDYLRKAVEEFTPDVGIVSAIVVGREPSGLGGWLEMTFLNTFYARWMVLAGGFGNPVVIGKSMLFRRSEAERFGGLAQLGRYLAEDYMAGHAMRMLGKQIILMREPVTQPIGPYSLKAFWSRHIRWGRIRKSQAPVAFFFEPWISSSLLAGVLGSISASTMFDISWTLFFFMHMMIWLGCDLVLMKTFGERTSLKSILAWLTRETTHLVLWSHIAMGSRVVWRGKILTLTRGGMLKV